METRIKFYEKQWFMWVTLVLFAPVGIFLMWKYKRFAKVPRIELSCFFALIFLVISISGQTGSTANTTSTNKTTAIAVAADQVKALAVDNLIADLGDPKSLTLDSVSKVQAARTSYEALTDSQKKLVTKYNILTNAETQLATLNEAAKEKAQQQASVVTVSGKLKVHFINVGQGDSILVQQGNQSMLVDAGPNAESSVVKNYISTQGITHLDYVIGTHPHEDHIGGLDYVINAFSIGKIYMPKASTNTKTYEDVLTAIKNKGMKITTPVPGDSFKVGDATVTILAPNASSYDDLNNYSIVLKVTYGNTSFLLEGDAQSLSESQMISKGFDLKADILKIGHHGSSSSTSDPFLNAVNPKYAAISVGAGNSYGHPTEQTMNRLQGKGISVYRTDECGTIIATSDGSSISFSTNPGSYKAASSGSSTSSSSSGSGTTSSTLNSSTSQTQNNDYTVYNTATGSKYHKDGCKYLSKSKTAITKSEAINEGLTPCSYCKP